jgi:hypothetical protein
MVQILSIWEKHKLLEIVFMMKLGKEYKDVSRSFWTESIMKYTLKIINT